MLRLFSIVEAEGSINSLMHVDDLKSSNENIYSNKLTNKEKHILINLRKYARKVLINISFHYNKQFALIGNQTKAQ